MMDKKATITPMANRKIRDECWKCRTILSQPNRGDVFIHYNELVKVLNTLTEQLGECCKGDDPSCLCREEKAWEDAKEPAPQEDERQFCKCGYEFLYCQCPDKDGE